MGNSTDDGEQEQRLPVDGLEVEEASDVDTERRFMREWHRSRLRELHRRAVLRMQRSRADGMIDK